MRSFRFLSASSFRGHAFTALFSLTACAPAATTPLEPTAGAPSPLGAEPGEGPEPGDARRTGGAAPGEVATEPAAPPARPARLARTSHPEGLQPLDEAESAHLAKECKALSDALTREAAAMRPRKQPGTGAAELTREALERVASRFTAENDARCVELMRRDLEVYVARTIETQAIMMLRMAALELSQKWAEEQRLCPSAGPVPQDLELLRQPRAGDELGPGLDAVRCAYRDFGVQPTRWSLELRTDPAKKTWEIVSRGFPAARGPATELFVAGTVGAEGIDPSVEVMRR